MKTTHNLKTTVSLLLIFLTCLFALKRIMPRAIVNDSVPPQEFSLARALDHLKIISEKPHFVSSSAHEEVREYLVAELEKLGLEVEIQEAEVLGQKNRTGTKVRNILTRIEGSEPGKALMLLSHYDSEVSTSFGASDAGSGVVVILESLRAFLEKGIPPKNDIIILISDAEELGLLGAQAFVDKNPWSKDVGLVLNFEARGSGGPCLMFVETNEGNEKLIQAFNKVNASRPFSNSLFYSVYKLLPNDTDLTVFRKNANVQGYNFAFIDDHFDYHTAQDSYERLDRNTVQHQASYLVPALAHFSMEDLNGLSADSDLVFFNFPGAGLISYPFSWVLPMCIIGLLALLLAVVWGLKKQVLSLKDMA
ncbi:MAG: M20/M25/M40 family metallo-hydrolase, partial [Lutimonas sp.]